MKLTGNRRCGSGGLYLELVDGNKFLEIHIHKTGFSCSYRLISSAILEYSSSYFIEDLVKFILSGGEV